MNLRHTCTSIPLFLALTSACATPSPSVDPAPAGPTWRGEVQPIVAAKCEGCHQAGTVAGFSLTNYEEVAAISTTVRDAVAQRRMPPWGAADGCNEYQGNISLTDEERETILDWVDAGSPEGDGPLAEVVPLTTAADLSRIDLVLEPAEPFVPRDSPDDYRCFTVDWPEEEQSFVTGYQVIPDAESIVHHVIAYILPGKYRADLEALEAEDGRPGYSCYGGPGPINLADAAWLGGWAPGSIDRQFPEGTGIRVEAGSIIVLQMHYNIPKDNEIADQTRINVMVSDDADVEAWIQPFANPFWIFGDFMEIPARSTDHEESFSFTFQDGATIYSANLHMHQLGQSGRFTLQHTDGTETCLLNVPKYDFDWQRSYAFKEPVVIGPGETLKLSCKFDNPTDEPINWGDGTSDEMCLTTMYMID